MCVTILAVSNRGITVDQKLDRDERALTPQGPFRRSPIDVGPMRRRRDHGWSWTVLFVD